MAETSPVRMGVLGCADIAWRRTLPAFAASDRVEIVAVASRHRDKACRFAQRFGCQAVTGYDALLERSDIEAVYIPLPTGLHAEWCAKALEAGKHVLVEKPLAATHREASGLVALADRFGLCLMENRMFAYHSQHAAVRELVAAGAIGELRVFGSTMAVPPRPAEDIRYRPDLGGGALLDVGYYPLQASLLFLAQPLAVIGAALHVDPAHGVDVRGSVLLGAADGVTAHLTFGLEHSYRSGYELWGSRGRLILERAFTPPATWQPAVRIEQQDRVEVRTLPPFDQFRASVDTFAAAVRDGVPVREHLRLALRGAALMDAVRQAASLKTDDSILVE
ncbi:Gfo/Idh/MocA family protein [Thermoactinospora rubra]|uniref:Gfo/Idh/MocA family protein n=1 Tax=Thermoactinospora rubra TaxID=1088767 RepID=UPI000A10692B|nr:Gfo/Idh/MocA family oxidoreductase [Thermoactinospora rubra]